MSRAFGASNSWTSPSAALTALPASPAACRGRSGPGSGPAAARRAPRAPARAACRASARPRRRAGSAASPSATSPGSPPAAPRGRASPCPRSARRPPAPPTPPSRSARARSRARVASIFAPSLPAIRYSGCISSAMRPSLDTAAARPPASTCVPWALPLPSCRCRRRRRCSASAGRPVPARRSPPLEASIRRRSLACSAAAADVGVAGPRRGFGLRRRLGLASRFRLRRRGLAMPEPGRSRRGVARGGCAGAGRRGGRGAAAGAGAGSGAAVPPGVAAAGRRGRDRPDATAAAVAAARVAEPGVDPSAGAGRSSRPAMAPPASAVRAAEPCVTRASALWTPMPGRRFGGSGAGESSGKAQLGEDRDQGQPGRRGQAEKGEGGAAHPFRQAVCRRSSAAGTTREQLAVEAWSAPLRASAPASTPRSAIGSGFLEFRFGHPSTRHRAAGRRR